MSGDRDFPSLYSLLADGVDDDDPDLISTDEARQTLDMAFEMQQAVERYAQRITTEQGLVLWERVTGEMDVPTLEEIEEEALGLALSSEMTIDEARTRVALLYILLTRVQSESSDATGLRRMAAAGKRMSGRGKKSGKAKRKR